ncbi:hypothetical protein GCM10028791_34930 [Echinicola sediminis]
MIKERETSTEHYKKLIEVLGKKYVRTKIESPYDFIYLASKGINAAIINNFRDYFNISREDTANMLNISSPTLYRWVKSSKSLEKNYSILLFELTDLFLYGQEVFDSKENFSKWLNLPNTALGGMEPLELLEVPGGISKVKDIIGRIEHGVYS